MGPGQFVTHCVTNLVSQEKRSQVAEVREIEALADDLLNPPVGSVESQLGRFPRAWLEVRPAQLSTQRGDILAGWATARRSGSRAADSSRPRSEN